MSKKIEATILPEDDHGGRRCGLDRRKFSYTEHVPERRSGSDRRTAKHPCPISPENPDPESLTL
ncbi:MAG: hypothetical protein MUD16_16615 [Desulfobacterales bacterium]|nr:hypothetical protein [Desulfobacterales bacterium]